eukprot:g5113.t1
MGKKGRKKKSDDGEESKGGAPQKSEAPPAADAGYEDFDFQEPVQQIVRPPDQLDLTEAELQETVVKVMQATDPNVPHNVTEYGFKAQEFKMLSAPVGDNMCVHFAMDGNQLFVESEEAKAQAAWELEKERAVEDLRRAAKDADGDDGDVQEVDTGKNQFNYSERAAQTFNNQMRERGIATEPPPVLPYAATVTQWDMYDTYMESFEFAEKASGDGKSGGAAKEAAAPDASKKEARDEDVIHSQAMGRSLKILERMVNQNAEDEIFQDFKYWEDQSDQFREGEGSLLPLWRFSTERSKRKQVTSICWNPRYPDLFAVGYGSYDFMRQGSGMICCFSLKNTSHPEYTFSTESGVMCVDFHPQHHALLAVGCYDGTVMVYDVRNKVNKPIYVSSIKTGKHTDPVWQVVWQEEDIAKELNFFSISSDGRVANWIMSKNCEFKMEPVMQLKLVNTQKDEPDEETSLTGLAGGCCFDFNRTSEHLFIVGTEEGKIHKCSKAYSGQYLETYEGHHMAVYSVKWNTYHPRVFISCSADWTVKLWDHNCPYPIMSFDLFNAVGDASWAPYSSTVFAAVTSDGKVHVFDLNENKHEPLCEQKVVKRARLTHVVFNKRDPIILVGDDRGGVNSLKLSPNLRQEVVVEKDDEKEKKKKKAKDEPEVAKPTRLELEIQKVDKLLAAADARPDDD